MTVISLSNFSETNKVLLDEFQEALSRVVQSKNLILGPEVAAFETAFADYINVKHAVGVGNGTDALVLALKALEIGEGDEVITVANSFLASTSCVALAGALAVFADIGPDLNIAPDSIRRLINPKTKAIIAVHLTGRPACMSEINKLADEAGIFVIEDAAQAAGAAIDGIAVGSLGHIGAFSFHPNKTLAALGDGGILTTNDDQLARNLRILRNHGLEKGRCLQWSKNSRLDELQAAFLSIKLKYLDEWNQRRIDIAHYYTKRLQAYVECPVPDKRLKSVYHTYIIKSDQRDALSLYLSENGIESCVHYPNLVSDHPAWDRDLPTLATSEEMKDLILSLPIHETFSNEQIERVVETVISFFVREND